MFDNERLINIERRQDIMIAAMNALADTMQVNNAMLAELAEWLKTPPSSALPELLEKLVATVGEQRLAIHAMREEVHLLPERVARAVVHGELAP